jgi:outer membrane protein assembly factor BamB
VADKQNLPLVWNAKTGAGIQWKVEIPGLAHSSPIVVRDSIYLTTAVSGWGDASFKPGLYGSGDASEDHSKHEWRLLCLNKDSGGITWNALVTSGRPKDKRHIKSTYANATPASDGKHLVAFFGSEGIFGYTLAGEQLWKRDLGRLDVGAYDLPEYEWGTASSPVIHEGRVIVQGDTQKASFLIALDIKTGETVWRTDRDELPSWGTPTIYPGKDRTEIITNGSNYIRGYDFDSGKELWRLGGSSKITAPTPVWHDDLIIVASGRAPERPVFAIQAGAKGDITLKRGEEANAFVRWFKPRRGPYMPSPLIYQNRVYTLGNGGLFGCYDLQSGEEKFYARILDHQLGFSASPIAADGKIYLAGEVGKIFVIAADDTFKMLAAHDMGEALMATPALADGHMYIRGERHLFSVGAQ